MPSRSDVISTARSVTMVGLQIVADIVPVPGLSVVLAVMDGINDACSGGQVHKEGFEEVRAIIQRMRGPLEDHYERIEKSNLNKTVDYILGELEPVAADVKEWSSYSWLRAFLHRKIIGDGLQRHKDRLDSLYKQFSVHASHVIAEDTKDAIKEYEDLLKQLEDLQEMSHRNDDDLYDENNVKITRIQLEERFSFFQKQLEAIEDRIGRRGPPRLTKSQLQIPSGHNVILGTNIAGSEVVRGTYLGNVTVAVKKLRALKVDAKYIKRFNNDLKIWAGIGNHEHILKVIGWAEVDQHFALVSRWHEHRDITWYCGHTRDADRLHLLAGAADGLKYLHSLTSKQHCVHGNLKGSNILVNDKLEAVLHDFQMARVVREMIVELKINTSHTRGASPRWQAPEASGPLTAQPHSDVWSFGMVMLEVFTLQIPFPEQLSDMGVRTAVCAGTIAPKRPQTDWVTDAVWELMQDCWKQPTERPVMEEVHRRLLEAEQYRAENPPEEIFNHPKQDPYQRRNHEIHGISYW